LLAATVFFVSSAASAVTLDVIGISGANPASMSVGETITIDVRVLADSDQVFALGASAYGYNESIVDYVDASGQAVASIFHAIALPSVGIFAGLENALPATLAESAIGSNGNRVWLFTGTALSSTGAQPDDPGLDGMIGNGDAQFRFSFEATGPGTTQIVIGTGYEGDGVVLASGQVAQAVEEIIDVSVGDGTAVPSLPSIALYTLLPMLLVGAGILALRNGNRVGQS
jgi:hypothetical protein